LGEVVITVTEGRGTSVEGAVHSPGSFVGKKQKQKQNKPISRWSASKKGGQDIH
jgi:hypothetical protein